MYNDNYTVICALWQVYYDQSWIMFVGLHDYSPFLALHTVLDFWEALGEDRVHQYIHGLCRQAGNGNIFVYATCKEYNVLAVCTCMYLKENLNSSYLNLFWWILTFSGGKQQLDGGHNEF
jgi:hypothetical protein